MYQVGIIGCGKPWKSEGATGFGMSHAHAEGYKTSPDAKIVALADIVEESAKAFQELRGGDRIYTSYQEMLDQEDLDIVSISTWPHLHAPMVIDCAKAGVKAIHCEKPMAPTFGECKQMVAACEASGTQLTFNHQRRFGAPYVKTKELIEAGAIGKLLRMEATCPDLFDWGTHWFDMLNMFNDEGEVAWVIGQVDMRNHRVVFGVTLEGHGLSQFRYENGVMGFLTTGVGAGDQRLSIKVFGTEGMLEIGHSEKIPLRMWAKGQRGWTPVEVPSGMHGMETVKLGVHDLIDALKNERTPELAADKALRATEMIFATYESSRRRARIDLPLDVDDSPLHAMIDSGALVVSE